MRARATMSAAIDRLPFLRFVGRAWKSKTNSHLPFTPSIHTFHSRLEVEDEALELQHEQLRQPLEARAHVDLL